MARPIDKWFSMRTEFFGLDSYVLGFTELSPRAAALYVGSIAYVCRWGMASVNRSFSHMVIGPRPGPAIADLVEHGFWVPSDAPNHFTVAHEGTLWRRGTPLGRRVIHPNVRRYVMKRDEFACVECGSDEALSLDHIYPYSKGGSDEPSNLRVLCQSCNSSKGART